MLYPLYSKLVVVSADSVFNNMVCSCLECLNNELGIHKDT